MKYFFAILFLAVSYVSNCQTADFPKVFSAQKKKTVDTEFNEPKEWFREIKYIGPKKDTVTLSEDSYAVLEENVIPIEIARRLYYYNFDCDNCIDITIDTNQVLTLFELEWKRNKWRNIYYKSYPVVIENKSDSLYKIGFGGNVRIILEALDVDNTWKPIEIPYMYRCGTGRRDLYLKSHQIACILIPIYHGNYSTQLRLKLNNNFSKPFFGSINKSQFYNPTNSY